MIQNRLLPVCRFVDKAIKATVIGHLFGDESSLLNASIDTTVREDQTETGKHISLLNQLSCQPRVTVMSGFVYKAIRDL